MKRGVLFALVQKGNELKNQKKEGPHLQIRRQPMHLLKRLHICHQYRQKPSKKTTCQSLHATKFAEVEDDTLLADFTKKPRKKNKEPNVGKEPQSP